jgi:hypothetical protein
VVTAKRGEWALEDADVRREAWYGRWVGVWKVVLGEGGCEIVGEEVIMSFAGQRFLGCRKRTISASAHHRQAAHGTFGRNVGKRGTIEDGCGRGFISSSDAGLPAEGRPWLQGWRRSAIAARAPLPTPRA